MDQIVETKVIEKVRKILLADSTVAGYVQDRIYAEHISCIDSPKYPAISIHLMPGQARTDVPEMVNMTFQVDLWMPADKYTLEHVSECFSRVRALLHRQNLTDSAIGITVGFCRESGIGPVMFDQDTNCRHLPARYNATAI